MSETFNPAQMMPRRVRIALGTIWVLSFLVALVSLRFAFVAIETAQPQMVHHVLDRAVVFYGHIAGASVALALLPIQFSKRFRAKRLRLHRWLGRIYGVSILVGGVAGIWLAATTTAGAVAGWGFGILGVVWIIVTARAIQLAMLGRIAEHRRWMIRSAALTLSAVTLRLYLPFLAISLGFDQGYTIVAWLCWVPNILAAELILRRQNSLSAQLV